MKESRLGLKQECKINLNLSELEIVEKYKQNLNSTKNDLKGMGANQILKEVCLLEKEMEGVRNKTNKEIKKNKFLRMSKSF